MKGRGPPMSAGRAVESGIRDQERPHNTPDPSSQAIAGSSLPRRPATWRAVQIAADPLFQNLVRRLIAQGERSVGELLAEIASRHGIERELRAALDRYTSIPHAALDVTSGRRFPRPPLSLVGAP